MRFLILILLIPYIGNAQLPDPDTLWYDRSCEAAYDAILQLRLDRADSLLHQAASKNPANGMYEYLRDYIDLLPVILNEDRSAYEEGRERRKGRIRILRRMESGSPWRDFCQGEIYFRWAIADYKMGHEWKAALGLVRANRYLSTNASNFPKFPLTWKSLGLIRALVGSIPVPGSLQWIAGRMTGIDPSVEGGYRMVSRMVDHPGSDRLPFHEEALVTLIYMDLHLRGDPELAWQRCTLLGVDPSKSPLACFVRANVAMRSGRNDRAIGILENRPETGSLPFPYLDFMLGEARLRRLEPDADIPLRRFLSAYPGRSFRKSAFERLFWHDILFGGEEGSVWGDRIDPGGETWTDADREAAFRMEQGEGPHPELLKARLLFDGGYCIRAGTVLDSVDVSTLSGIHRLEYHYRDARISHMTGHTEQALARYGRVIELGADRPEYYACNAALQKGLILEREAKFHLARVYFDRCLDLHPAGYVRSLHMQAKAGLNRIESALENK